ncbi:MAG: hypothetical protein CBC48_18545 [bacterium TMED88]|nr:hypothetical protein [Deltaproteobacteria bacterium]OUV23447.1 MAG: hypothetical protein CBC48_18545 [bacterium TMED88]
MFDTIRQLLKHSSIYGLGDLASRSIGFLMIPIYTHYLSTEQYGVLELLDLVSYVFGIVMEVGITQAVVRYYHQYDARQRDQLITMALVSIIGVSAVFLTPMMLSAPWISSLVFETPDFSRFLNITFATLAIQLLNGVPMTLLRIQERSVLFVSISLSRLLLSLSLNILFIVYLDFGVEGILLSGLITSGLLGLFLISRLLTEIRISFDASIARSMLTYSAPLLGSWAGMYILNFGDRFFLQRFDGLADIGIYALAYKFGMMPNMLILSPFLRIWGPKRFEIVEDPNARPIFGHVFSYFWFVQLFVVLGISTLIPDVIQVIAGSEFQTAARYVPLLLVGYMAYGAYSYFQFGLLLEKKTLYLGGFVLAVAGLNVAMNFILIPKLGIMGAAVSTASSFTLLAGMIFLYSQSLYRIPYEGFRLLVMTSVALCLYFLSSSIPIKDPAWAIGIKLLIALTFPLWLWMFGLVRDYEMNRIRDIWESVRGVAGKASS